MPCGAVDLLPLVALAGVPAGPVVELAAGRRFDAALQVARTGRVVFVMDRDAAVLGAPSPLRAFVDDLVRPDLAHYTDAQLLFARRIPEELQVPAAALARRLGVSLWFRPFKDELAETGPTRLVDGWRVLNP